MGFRGIVNRMEDFRKCGGPKARMSKWALEVWSNRKGKLKEV